MRFARSLAAMLLLVTAAIAGILDAAAKKGLVGRDVAASLILGSLVVMVVCVGAASRDHRSLVINTMLAAASAAVSYMVFTSLVDI